MSPAGPTSPTAPIELTGSRTRLATPLVPVPDTLLAGLGAVCPTTAGDDPAIGEASRDWWPLAMHWALDGMVPQRAAAICRPATTEEVAAVLSACNRAAVPVTAAGGRSGVCGASVPVFGGVLLDLTGLAGVVAVDVDSGLVRVRSGTFGPDLEDELRADHGLSVGHFPQSFELATVGGWVACRGAGQYSTRYGKIEHMVTALEVVLADGTIVRTGGSPAAATGPDLTQLFLGSEGTLGVITEVTLRVHPLPPAERQAAYRVPAFAEGIEACRRILRRGATPAVLRLYDGVETQRSHGGDGSWCALLVLDEGDPGIVDATMAVVEEECGAAGIPLGADPVGAWMVHRNDTSALQPLTRKGLVVDTMEIAAPWSALDGIVDSVIAALMAVPGARVASCHLSHSYSDGACLYFTFAATPPGTAEDTYVAMWDAGQRAVLAAGGNLSHHHGVGLNRARFVAEALGTGVDVLAALKQALDPRGILNPGKLGLPSPYGAVDWP